MFVCPFAMVLIEPLKDEVVLHGTGREYKTQGKVIGTALFEQRVKVGDVIFFDDFSYRRYEHEGKDYCIVNIGEGALWGK